MSEPTLKIENNKTQGQTIKVYCSQCKLSTNHEVMQSVDIEDSTSVRDEGVLYGTIDWTDAYQIIKCQGCDSISFRNLNWCSENIQQISEDEWENGETEYLYPERSADNRSEREFSMLPGSLRRIYREVVDCYNRDSRILCAVGLRAIIEGICSSQNITKGPLFQDDGITPKLRTNGSTPVRRNTLEGKINGLHEKGILTKISANALHEHRFLGNDAVHELQLPTKKVLGLALDIVEHMLDALYGIPDKAEDLRRIRTKK